MKEKRRELMKKQLFILLALTAVLSFTVYGLLTDVSGDWDMTISSQRGERTSVMTIEQDGDKITVTMEGFRGDEMTGEGTVSGENIEWTVKMETPRGEFSITYKGIVSGDTMSGEAQMGDRGSMEWSAKKK
jgi:hypothetical protein